jgi:polar amino acid transport system substrate-binding protein
MAVEKGNTSLARAVQAALQELIDNGEYQKLLEKYDVAGSAVKGAQLNAGN